MKLIVAAIVLLLIILDQLNKSKKIDWSKIVPVTDLPGFWRDRDIKPGRQMLGSSRIAGGFFVAPNSLPFQAALLCSFPAGVGLCGGSIIADYAILTAAHCIVGTKSVEVILGANLLFDDEKTQQRFTIEPWAYRVHYAYNTSNFNNDIALLITPSRIKFNAWVSPVAVPDLGDTKSYLGEFATVSGWGKTADGSAISPQLRSVRNFIVSNDECAAVYGTGIVINGTICMSTRGNRAPCGGDSGGPLTIMRNNSVLQVGVVSFGASSGCGFGYPAGFTRITTYRNLV